jgi:excisionase family DNA binding protein
MIRLTVQEYASQMNIDKSTVYRHVKSGKLTTEKVDGTLYIFAAASQLDAETSQVPLTKFLVEENGWLKKRVETLEEELNESRQRSDTIILQLTRQFDEQTKLLEDLRQKQDAKWYQRLFRR